MKKKLKLHNKKIVIMPYLLTGFPGACQVKKTGYFEKFSWWRGYYRDWNEWHLARAPGREWPFKWVKDDEEYQTHSTFYTETEAEEAIKSEYVIKDKARARAKREREFFWERGSRVVPPFKYVK